MDPVLSLRVRPDWDEVDRVRERSAAFLAAHALPSEDVDALSMVTCELTENAVKYGRFGQGAEDIGVSVSVGPRAVTVEVRSPVAAADDSALARLDYMVQWIRGHQDPFEAYLARLREVSTQPMENAESGLGLVRIAYEGHSILDLFVDESNVLSVSAVYPLDATPGARS